MPIFATEYTEIDCLPGFTVDTDLFSVDLVVALGGIPSAFFLNIRRNQLVNRKGFYLWAIIVQNHTSSISVFNFNYCPNSSIRIIFHFNSIIFSHNV